MFYPSILYGFSLGIAGLIPLITTMSEVKQTLKQREKMHINNLRTGGTVQILELCGLVQCTCTLQVRRVSGINHSVCLFFVIVESCILQLQCVWHSASLFG